MVRQTGGRDTVRPTLVLPGDKMNYKLSVANDTYLVEDIQLPTGFTPAQDPIGQPFSFVSPVPMRTGQCCVLRGDAVGYQLLVDVCFGFTFTPRYLVSGIITTKEATASTS